MLFSGQEQLPGLIEGAGTWSVSALALLMASRGLAWGISLGGFRGGPTFPGCTSEPLSASSRHISPVSPDAGGRVGLGAATVAVLRLPLSAVLLATVLTSGAGPGIEPLVIVGVVAAFLTTLALSERESGREAQGPP